MGGVAATERTSVWVMAVWPGVCEAVISARGVYTAGDPLAEKDAYAILRQMAYQHAERLTENVLSGLPPDWFSLHPSMDGCDEREPGQIVFPCGLYTQQHNRWVRIYPLGHGIRYRSATLRITSNQIPILSLPAPQAQEPPRRVADHPVVRAVIHILSTSGNVISQEMNNNVLRVSGSGATFEFWLEGQELRHSVNFCLSGSEHHMPPHLVAAAAVLRHRIGGSRAHGIYYYPTR